MSSVSPVSLATVSHGMNAVAHHSLIFSFSRAHSDPYSLVGCAVSPPLRSQTYRSSPVAKPTGHPPLLHCPPVSSISSMFKCYASGMSKWLDLLGWVTGECLVV